MPNPVLILHGWSDNARSFVPLKRWLVAQGRRTEDVFFGNYESMEDHVTFDDLADGLQTRLDALTRLKKITLAPFSIDVIVHSTGGPVIRHWLTHYVRDMCKGDRARCPIARLIMLAPANFGSRLAAQGKTTLAKVFRGGVTHGFMTGRRILEGLELGSPVLWQMAENDLFCGNPIYPVGPKGPWVFVFSGTPPPRRSTACGSRSTIGTRPCSGARQSRTRDQRRSSPSSARQARPWPSGWSKA